MPVYEFFGFRVDTDKRELVCDGMALALPPRAHDLLAHLLANRHRVVSKAELLEQVWRNADVSDAAVHRTIVILRGVLDQDASGPSMIRTLNRIGYRFAAVVQVWPDVGQASASDAVPGPTQPVSALAGHAVSDGTELPRVAIQVFDNDTGDPAHDWARWGLPRLVCEGLAQQRELAVVNLDAVASALAVLPTQMADSRTLGGLLGARWTVAGRLLPGVPQGLQLAYQVHGGPAGEHLLQAVDVSALATALGHALVDLVAHHKGWRLEAPASDAFVTQALARAQAHVSRTEWSSAANLLRVVLDLEPGHTAARLMWLTVLPQLHDDSVFPEGERLLAEAVRLGDVRLQAATHEILGRASFNRQEQAWALTGRHHLEEALRLARPWAHEDWVLRIHLNLGYLLQLQGLHEAARPNYDAVLCRLESGGNPRFRAAALNNRALIECMQERPLVAANLSQDALDLCEQHNQLQTAISCRATRTLADLELGNLRQAERRATRNLAEITSSADIDADSSAWAVFVAAQLGFVLRGGGRMSAHLKEVRTRLPDTSAHSRTLLAAVDALLPLLEPSRGMDAEALAAQALLDAMGQSEQARLHEHTHHMARLALECALRARSASMLWRIRSFLEQRAFGDRDAGLERALKRAFAAEQVWRGEPEAACESLRQAAAGPPGGRQQALAHLDLAALLLTLGQPTEGGPHLAWVSNWIEELPEGLALRARWLASQGQFDAAVDTQLAALRQRRGTIPAGWYTALEHCAQGRSVPPARLNSLWSLD